MSPDSPNPSPQNPYQSPLHAGGDSREPQKQVRKAKLNVSSPCRAIFSVDLAFCVIRAVFVALLILAVVRGDRLTGFGAAWFVASSGVVLCGIGGNWLLLLNDPAGRWLGFANAVFSVAATWVPAIVATHDTNPMYVIYAGSGLVFGKVFGTFFLAMYIAALIECRPRKRNEGPAYRWTDWN